MTASIKTQLVLTVWVTSPWLAAQPLNQLQSVDDQCERGVSMPATDLNTASFNSYAVLQAVGQTYTVSASAALYVSTATAGRYPWHSKGGLGVLSWQAIGESGKSLMVLKECSASEEMFAKNTESLIRHC